MMYSPCPLKASDCLVSKIAGNMKKVFFIDKKECDSNIETSMYVVMLLALYEMKPIMIIAMYNNCVCKKSVY